MSDSTATDPEIPIPPRRAIASEFAGLLELPRLGWELRSLLREPRGDGSAVFVLPGFGADDRSTWPLRQFLSALGYDARGWSRGANRADVPDAIEAVGDHAEQTSELLGAPVSLVGWSLGGYTAREVARDRPRAVRRAGPSPAP